MSEFILIAGAKHLYSFMRKSVFNDETKSVLQFTFTMLISNVDKKIDDQTRRGYNLRTNLIVMH